MSWIDIQPYLIALGLGLLIGLQRESQQEHTAGIRTITLITLLGAASAALGNWTIAAGALAVTALMVASSFNPERKDGAGYTTEVASLLAYAIGALLVKEQTLIACLLAGATMVLLQFKSRLHGISKRLNEADLRAIGQLTLIGLIILPLLPDQTYGPYNVINPFKIWLMVVLIVGLSLLAYFIGKFIDQRKGVLAAGVLGGLISSTATTVSMSTRAKANANTSALLISVVLMIASTIVFARVLFEISLVALSRFHELAYPLIAMMGWMVLVTLVFFWKARQSDTPERADDGPPSDFKAAVVFGLLYALVRIGVAAANDHFGDQGVYIVAFISGLTDMDAITLSSAQMVASDTISADVGWRSILIGGMANLLFKGGIAATLGPRRLIKPIAIAFLISILGGLAILLFWP